MTLTVEQFAKRVIDEGLVSAEALDRVRQSLTADDAPAADALAEALVKREWLTRYQAKTLLQERVDSLRLGNYTILDTLGRGGFGRVFQARHRRMKRLVALKVLAPEVTRNEEAVRRFQREVEAIARLNHPHIVTAHDADESDGTHFLVMEYVEGSNLASLVKEQGPLPLKRAVDYIVQAAGGLQYAHDHGLIHRDIKPDNLLLDREETVKVADLGLARLVAPDAMGKETDASRLTSPRFLMGTPDYISPEQIDDPASADHRSDIYSLGCTFYFLLTGQAVYAEQSLTQRVLAHREGALPSLMQVRPDVPETLASLFEQMVARDPGERFQSMRELADSLRACAETDLSAEDEPDGADRHGNLPPTETWPLRSTSREASPLNTTEGAGSPEKPSAGPGRAAASAPRRHGLSAALILFAVLCGVAVLVWAGNPFSGTGRHQNHTRSENAAGTKAEHGPVVAGAAERRSLSLLVPVYFYPAGDGLEAWERLIRAAESVSLTAIVNPASGPGESRDFRYVQITERAARAGVRLIGYVETDYGERPLAEVQDEVDRWRAWYPSIHGIFFDEQAEKADNLGYYRRLSTYVRERIDQGVVVANPGTRCAEAYFAAGIADAICIVDRGTAEYAPPDWAHRYAPKRFAALIHSQTEIEDLSRFVGSLTDKHLGMVYVTDDGPPNSWDRLPTYWDGLVKAVAARSPAPTREAGDAQHGRDRSRPEPATTRAPGPVRIVVPAYFYPEGANLRKWNRLIAAARQVPLLVVVNCDDGPGSEVDPAYARVIAGLEKAGAKLVGYVMTEYGTRSTQAVRDEIERWLRFYPELDGIYFDQQATDPEFVPYYRELSEFVRDRRSKALVVNNPGAVCSENYFAPDIADAFNLVETGTTSAEFPPAGLAGRFPEVRFAANIYSAESPQAMQRTVEAALAAGIADIYVTDDGEPDPWDTLPGYWEKLVELVGRINDKRRE